jgi:hypothetical protein
VQNTSSRFSSTTGVRSCLHTLLCTSMQSITAAATYMPPASAQSTDLPSQIPSTCMQITQLPTIRHSIANKLHKTHGRISLCCWKDLGMQSFLKPFQHNRDVQLPSNSLYLCMHLNTAAPCSRLQPACVKAHITPGSACRLDLEAKHLHTANNSR